MIRQSSTSAWRMTSTNVKRLLHSSKISSSQPGSEATGIGETITVLPLPRPILISDCFPLTVTVLLRAKIRSKRFGNSASKSSNVSSIGCSRSERIHYVVPGRFGRIGMCSASCEGKKRVASPLTHVSRPK